MKPYLLVLLLAIPPLVCNVLACENNEPADGAPAATKSVSTAACHPCPTATIPAAATPAPKPVPTSGSVPARAKPWFM